MTKLNGYSVIAISIAILISVVVLCNVPYAVAGSPALTITAPDKMTADTTVNADLYLVDADSKPITGAVITLAYSGQLSGASSTVTTDSTGHAKVAIIVKSAAGTGSLTATYSTTSATKTVSVNGQPASLAILPKSTILNADGQHSYTLEVLLKDSTGTPCSVAPVEVEIDGVKETLYTSEAGIAKKELGPRTTAHTYSIVASTNGLSGTAAVRFIVAKLDYPDFSAEAVAGSEVPFTVALLDDTTPVEGIPITFQIQSPGSLATPSSYSGVTDTDGRITFNLKLSSKTGSNRIILSNPDIGNPTLGYIATKSIRGIGGDVAKVEIQVVPLPDAPVMANGVDFYKLKVWGKDSNDNYVRGVTLKVIKDKSETPYAVTLNDNGYGEFDLAPSPNTGTVHIDIAKMDDTILNTADLVYGYGPATKVMLSADPNVIASGEVSTPAGMEDVHETTLIAIVSDEWNHAIPGQSVTFSLAPDSVDKGTISEVTVVTDNNGQATTTFTLAPTATVGGTVNLVATSGTLPVATYGLKYTKDTFISMESKLTTVNNGQVDLSTNPYINVEITLKGVGWQNRAKPSDVMLVMDRSGSMDWNAKMVYPDPSLGSPLTGDLTRVSKYTFDNEVDDYNENSDNVFYNGIVGSSKWKQLGNAYYNTGTTPLTIQLNNANSANYYYLKVVAPDGSVYISGKNYDGVTSSHSSSTNSVTIANPVKGTYTIYGMMIRTNKNEALTYDLIIRSNTVINDGTVSDWYKSWSSAYDYASYNYDDNIGIYNNPRWTLIGDYTNDELTDIQFMLNSPYSNYMSTKNYYILMVVDPDGNHYVSYTGTRYDDVSTTRSNNENYVWFTNAKPGSYKIYGIQIGTGASAEYSSMVVTSPLRLGPGLSSTSSTDAAAKVSAMNFIESRGTMDKVGVVSFSDSYNYGYYTVPAARLDSPLLLMDTGNNKKTLKNKILALDADGGTNIAAGITMAMDELDGPNKRANAKQYIIILSDGYSQYPENDREAAELVKSKGYTIFTIGMGMPDEETLKNIASKPEYYYRVLDPAQLEAAYSDIGNEIGGIVAEDSDMQIISSGEQDLTTGMPVAHAEYVPDTGITTHTDGSIEKPSNPTITFTPDYKYKMTWHPGVIKLNQVWKLQYQLRANKVGPGGMIIPITSDSFVEYTREDGTVEKSYFTQKQLNAYGTLNGNINNLHKTLVVDLIEPQNGDTVTKSGDITWSVAYTNTGTYNQFISIKNDVDGTVWSKELDHGIYSRSSSGSFTFPWDNGDWQDGQYTITVSAEENNGNVDLDYVTVVLSRGQGSIWLKDAI